MVGFFNLNVCAMNFFKPLNKIIGLNRALYREKIILNIIFSNSNLNIGYINIIIYTTLCIMIYVPIITI